MPCEFLVPGKPDGSRRHMEMCGREANYFLVTGAIATAQMWLCWRHEQMCEQQYRWTLQRIPPPEPPPGNNGEAKA